MNIKRLLTAVLICIRFTAAAQGRVVINEYLPWPLNGCGVTSEFVELLNFGPGPINIGCYIVTDGDYAITIPPNTILQPGQFYVISGQDVISQPCDNVDSTIHAHLNWNTCNCTSAPIPTTGDGFLTDGGSAAEQVVLLDPALNVVDAVIRKLPAEPSSLITSSAVGGGCTTRTFDLDFMNIEYETIGESDGRGNSMARKTDGDCGWVKDSRQSGNATNNTPGEVSSLDASFYLVSFRACPPTFGGIRIVINSGNMSDIFPMKYTLAWDSNGNNVFDVNDTYTTGIDSTPNSIAISGLAAGRYRIVIETRLGCNLTVFDFVILDCFIVLNADFLWAGIVHNNGSDQLSWQVSENEMVQNFTIEGSASGTDFEALQSVSAATGAGNSRYQISPLTKNRFYRIKMLMKNGRTTHSAVIAAGKESAAAPLRLLGNPVANGKLQVEINGPTGQRMWLRIFDARLEAVAKFPVNSRSGSSRLTFTLPQLPGGLYFMALFTQNGQECSTPVKFFATQQAP